MTLNYNRVWTTMNELEMVTSKISSAREILDSAIDALENHNGEKAETLMYAADEFLKYYLADFDVKFKDAWNETVMKIKDEEHIENIFLSSHSDDSITFGEETQTYDETVKAGYEMTADGFWIPSQKEDNMPPWGHSDMEALSQQKEDKVVKWRIPVEMDGPSGEYFITFPDDLLEAANLNPGDEVEWVEQQEVGSFILRKVTKPLGMDEC
jgi:hypothetical protein